MSRGQLDLRLLRGLLEALQGELVLRQINALLLPEFLSDVVDELFVDAADARTTPTHVHLAFQARDRAMVDAFYKAALANGGTDNGPPGERSYHPGYYAAFVLDPDGNNIEAVYHGPSRRSAESVVIDPA
jgi:catechol 2,3-dioxygenase-like lactoylglutathione lyase family enzyme